MGHWTRDDNQNAIELFTQFARARNASAQDPAFWYSLKRSDLFNEKVLMRRRTKRIKYGNSKNKKERRGNEERGLFLLQKTSTIIKNYNGSCTKTLLDLFPNIGLDPQKLFCGWSMLSFFWVFFLYLFLVCFSCHSFSFRFLLYLSLRSCFFCRAPTKKSPFSNEIR